MSNIFNLNKIKTQGSSFVLLLMILIPLEAPAQPTCLEVFKELSNSQVDLLSQFSVLNRRPKPNPANSSNDVVPPLPIMIQKPPLEVKVDEPYRAFYWNYKDTTYFPGRRADKPIYLRQLGDHFFLEGFPSGEGPHWIAMASRSWSREFVFFHEGELWYRDLDDRGYGKNQYLKVMTAEEVLQNIPLRYLKPGGITSLKLIPHSEGQVRLILNDLLIFINPPQVQFLFDVIPFGRTYSQELVSQFNESWTGDYFYAVGPRESNKKGADEKEDLFLHSFWIISHPEEGHSRMSVYDEIPLTVDPGINLSLGGMRYARFVFDLPEMEGLIFAGQQGGLGQVLPPGKSRAGRVTHFIPEIEAIKLVAQGVGLGGWDSFRVLGRLKSHPSKYFLFDISTEDFSYKKIPLRIPTHLDFKNILIGANPYIVFIEKGSQTIHFLDHDSGSYLGYKELDFKVEQLLGGRGNGETSEHILVSTTGQFYGLTQSLKTDLGSNIPFDRVPHPRDIEEP